MKRTSFQHLELLSYNEGAHLDMDYEENVATVLFCGTEYYAIIPPSIDGGAA